MTHKGFNLGVLTTVGHAQLHDAGHFLTKAHAACALDTAAHLLHAYQWAGVLGVHHAFFFIVTRGRTTVTHGQILQLALTALVTNGAIEGVIDEQKLHHRLLGLDGFVALGADDHALRHRCGAGRHGFRGFFHIDQTHAAVGRDAEFLVIAKMWNICAGLFSCVHDHAAFLDVNLFTVEFDFNHGTYPSQT